jgi:endonuclease YncB( thermonuclease family)
MRGLTAGTMVAGVVALSLAIAYAGRAIMPAPARPTQVAKGEVFGPPVPTALAPPGMRLEPLHDPPRPVAAATVAPPQLDYRTLEREAPRGPLGPLGQALPPVKPDDWGGTILYRPVAVASAEFEAMGFRIAIAGTESVDPRQTCNFEGAEWPCGVSARTAVRLWLRGRALSCLVPSKADRQLLVAGCRLGKQDVGAWLVSNGWARATAGGPYASAEEQARTAKAGIFGPPPTTDAN